MKMADTKPGQVVNGWCKVCGRTKMLDYLGKGRYQCWDCGNIEKEEIKDEKDEV